MIQASTLTYSRIENIKKCSCLQVRTENLPSSLPKRPIIGSVGLDENNIRQLYGEEWRFRKRKLPKVQTQFEMLRKVIQSSKKRWTHLQTALIINPDSGWKSIWDLFVITIVFYSCFTSFFWSSFYPQGFEKYYYIEFILEFLFLLDIIVNLLTSFKDSASQIEASTIKETAVHYIKRFILIGLSVSFFFSCAWYIYLTSDLSDDQFLAYYDFEDMNVFTAAVTCYYFMLSTLATVGYGDYAPQSPGEKVISIIIMVIGVAFFSYIINNFNNIMKNYHIKLGYIDKIPELEEWMLSLNKKKDRAMESQLVKSIYDHYNYFYGRYKLLTLSKQDKYFKLMTEPDKKQIIRHLFQDVFLGQFRTFFLQKGKIEYSDYQFYIDMAFALLPRKYKAKEIILNQGDAVQEMYLLLEGEIEVFFYLDGIKISKYFQSGFQFGSVHILSNSLSNFTYRATSTASLYGIKKEKFLKIFHRYPGMKEDMIKNVFGQYKLTRKSMIEELITSVKRAKSIQLKDEEANNLFDLLNKKFCSKVRQNKSNIQHKFTGEIKEIIKNYLEKSDVDETVTQDEEEEEEIFNINNELILNNLSAKLEQLGHNLPSKHNSSTIHSKSPQSPRKQMLSQNEVNVDLQSPIIAPAQGSSFQMININLSSPKSTEDNNNYNNINIHNNTSNNKDNTSIIRNTCLKLLEC